MKTRYYLLIGLVVGLASVYFHLPKTVAVIVAVLIALTIEALMYIRSLNLFDTESK